MKKFKSVFRGDCFVGCKDHKIICSVQGRVLGIGDWALGFVVLPALGKLAEGLKLGNEGERLGVWGNSKLFFRLQGFDAFLKCADHVPGSFSVIYGDVDTVLIGLDLAIFVILEYLVFEFSFE